MFGRGAQLEARMGDVTNRGYVRRSTISRRVKVGLKVPVCAWEYVKEFRGPMYVLRDRDGRWMFGSAKWEEVRDWAIGRWKDAERAGYKL